MWIYLRLSVSIILVFLLSNFNPSVSHAQKLKKIYYGLPAFVIEYAPTIVTENKGFFREEGLNIQIVKMTSTVGIAGLIAGNVDYIGSASSPIVAIVRGAGLKVIFALLKEPNFDLIVKPEIKSIGELKGKIIGTAAIGGITYIAVREILTKNKLIPDKDTALMFIGPADLRFAALKGGAVDGVPLNPPYNFSAMKEGFRKLAYTGDYLKTLQSGITTSDRKIKGDPDEILRIIKSSYKGLLYYRKNKEGSIPPLMKFFGIKEISFANMIYDYSMPGFTEEGLISPELMRTSIDKAKEATKVTKEIKNEEVFDFSFVEKAKRVAK